MDIELVQQLIEELGFAPAVLRKGIICEVPRYLVNDVWVAIAANKLEGWTITGTIPEDKIVKVAFDIAGNGSGLVVDTGVLYLKVSDRLLIEPRE